MSQLSAVITDVMKRRQERDANKMSVRILDMIEERQGMRSSRIQAELWKMSHPDEPFTRAHRGWWCTNLFGAHGLLRFYCQRSGSKWVRKPGVDHNGRPWRTMTASRFRHQCYCGAPLFAVSGKCSNRRCNNRP